MSELVIIQIMDGIGVGMIYFVIAVGLSIVFGIMDFANFAHGVFYLVGAYAVYSVSSVLNFWVALVLGPLFVMFLAFAVERTMLRHLYGTDHTLQVILTFGLTLIIPEVVTIVWGPAPLSVLPPSSLQGPVHLLGLTYPAYRLFVIVVGAILVLTVWYVLERTRYGAILRAGTESIEMISALGVNIRRVFAITFAVGAFLAGLAGGLAAPVQTLFPFAADNILGIAFAVVAIGGLNSFLGTLVAALSLGILQSLTVMVEPRAGSVVIYLAMAVFLMWPGGLVDRLRAMQHRGAMLSKPRVS